MRAVARFAATAVVSFLLYLLLTGSVAGAELIAGAVIALVAAALMSALPPLGSGILNPARIARAVAYLPYFLWKVVEANLSLAWIVIRPSLPIAPSVVRAKTSLASAPGKLLLTSSVTLTPGTLSVDVDGDDIYIHCVTADDRLLADPSTAILAPFEKRLKGVTE